MPIKELNFLATVGVVLSGSLPAFPTGGTGTVALSIVDQFSDVGPAAVLLDAAPGAGLTVPSAPAGTPFDPELHDVKYFWRVVGEPLTMERAGSLNMPAEWKDPNIRMGKTTAFVFDTENTTYTIECLAVDGAGNYATSSIQYVTGSADTKFPGSATICFSPPGSDFVGAPAGATQVTTEAQAATEISNRAGAATRFLFRAGVDFRSNVTSQIDFSSILNDVLIQSFGSGAKPIIPLMPKQSSNATAIFGYSADGSEIKGQNIDMRGKWDAATETGQIGGTPIWHNTSANILFHGCRIEGHALLWTQTRDGDCMFVWSDGEITNWQDMGIFGAAHSSGTKRKIIINSDIHQKADALQGALSNADKNQSNVHGPGRFECHYPAANGLAYDELYLICVDMFSRNGWSVGAGGSADQPCVRLNSAGGADVRMVSDRCAFEGGYQTIKMRGEDFGTLDVPGNYWFNNLITRGTPETLFHLEGTYGGVTFENWYAFRANVPSIDYDESLIRYEDPTAEDAQQPGNIDSPVRFNSLTYLNLITAAPSNPYDTSEFTALTNDNALYSAPNRSGGAINAGLVDTATAIPGMTHRFAGALQSIRPQDSTTSSTTERRVPYSTFTDWNGNPTDQAYWQARIAAGSNKTAVRDTTTDEYLHQEEGDLTVSAADPTDLVVTRTSGTWVSGALVTVKPDQSDNKPALDATYDMTGEIVPYPTLLSAQDVVSGEVPEVDLLLNARPGSVFPNAPAGTPQQGAFESVSVAPTVTMDSTLITMDSTTYTMDMT